MIRRKLGYLAVLLLGVFTLSFILGGCEQSGAEPVASETAGESNDETDAVLEGEDETDSIIDEDDLSTLEGTIVAILADDEEVLFVAQLDISDELLDRDPEDWFTYDNLYRLSGIDSVFDVGTEIRISFAITTMSLPPLVPVLEYEIIN